MHSSVISHERRPLGTPRFDLRSSIRTKNPRRRFIVGLLLLAGPAPSLPRSVRLVERDGWLLDASDR